MTEERSRRVRRTLMRRSSGCSVISSIFDELNIVNFTFRANLPQQITTSQHLHLPRFACWVGPTHHEQSPQITNPLNGGLSGGGLLAACTLYLRRRGPHRVLRPEKWGRRKKRWLPEQKYNKQPSLLGQHNAGTTTESYYRFWEWLYRRE